MKLHFYIAITHSSLTCSLTIANCTIYIYFLHNLVAPCINYILLRFFSPALLMSC